MSAKPAKSRNRLAEVVLDEATIPRGAADVDHERTVAIFDLIEENSFGVPGRDDGPYVLKISQEESKLTFEVENREGRDRGHDRGVDDAVPAVAQGLFPRLRDLLFGDPRLEPAPDRGDRPRTHEAAQRRRGAHGAAA